MKECRLSVLKFCRLEAFSEHFWCVAIVKFLIGPLLRGLRKVRQSQALAACAFQGKLEDSALLPVPALPLDCLQSLNQPVPLSASCLLFLGDFLALIIQAYTCD